MTSQSSSFYVPPSTLNPKKLKKWYKKWWGRAIIIFLVIFFILVIAVGFYIFRLSHLIKTGQIDLSQFGVNVEEADLSAIRALATSDDPSFGPRDAKVIIVEFSDFECPFCGQAYPVVKEILRNYGDKIHFVYRDFPLADIHPQAVLAALAGECAHEQGKFWQMHDKIFENQAILNEANLKIWAVQIGLNSIQFGDCLDTGKYLSEIEQDVNDGIKAGAKATPTFFVNNRRIEGAIPLSAFEQIILSELTN